MTDMTSMIYIGSHPVLKGEAALVKKDTDVEGGVKAQFHNMYLTYGYGWHKFLATDFEAIPPDPLAYMEREPVDLTTWKTD